MNVYQAFFSLKPGVKDMDFCEALRVYMEYLQNKGHLQKWRLLRRKLGLGPKEMGEFHLLMEFESLDHLDQAFSNVATRQGEVEKKHHGVNHMIDKITFSLYRDFPDECRVVGGEEF
eukprot:CAMPEP_0118688632 /NCGR_PEP_ID=MMETSP0800-20121206/9030_1 /TAXON_ID=210618 ORGANISM="Striatella unipunctata, Strain CCMP2910" /NCGR_SAMPLE_ID=MMETSP0800 /ASSEMBLY_ACC=CAM_ASM_000638 /LENGTH=116 /DNA_ID=CAMNT_0006585917 /DNA_START=310 /DNA_END=660 /DNA_ORIENTATION=-